MASSAAAASSSAVAALTGRDRRGASCAARDRSELRKSRLQAHMLRPQPPRFGGLGTSQPAREEPSCSLERAAELELEDLRRCERTSCSLDDALLLQAADCYSWSGASTAAACGLTRLRRLGLRRQG